MINEIKTWFELAKPNPTIEDACVQIGCHYEEVAEMADALADDVKEILNLSELWKGTELTSYMWISKFSHHQKIELLDALCDQIVTSVGVAHMLRMDIEGALKEVNRSNFSKFENGLPVFNEQGKIAKGKDYTPPSLEDFVK